VVVVLLEVTSETRSFTKTGSGQDCKGNHKQRTSFCADIPLDDIKSFDALKELAESVRFNHTTNAPAMYI
jgi:hypothetical protein